MSRYLYIAILVAALVVLAVGGWAVQGLRALRAPRADGRRARLTPRPTG